jgi:cysteinyl-tRNA synthetase
MHNAFLNIDNKKMSKSLGNFFTVREITEKYDPQVLRFVMLNAHYRSPLNFSADLMESAKNSLERILNAAENLRAHMTQEDTLTDADQENLKVREELVQKFCDAMEDDFNTADALAAIFEIVKLANTTVDGASSAYAKELYHTLETLSGICGLKVEVEEEILDSDIEELIQKRQDARKNKDFALADQIRDELLEKGIELKDTREGVKWKRI